jgi:ferredoxin
LRLVHKRQGFRFENDWGMDVLEEDAKNVTAGITLPVYEEVNLNNTILNLDMVKRYLERATKIAVTECACRTKRKHCDAPINVCIELNDKAKKDLEKGSHTSAGGMIHPVREVTTDEALDIVTIAHEAGLVPMAYISTSSPEPHEPIFICNCCSCCCSIFGLTLRFGMAPHILKSLAITMNNSSKCIGCGKCVDRCHFGARNIKNGKLEYNKDLCFGCGLCVSTCPEKAITLIQLL